MLNINFKKNSFITFFIITFYEVFIKLWSTFNPPKVIHWKLFWHFPTKWIIYPIFNIWRLFIFIIIFHVFIVSFCISMNRVTFLLLYLFPPLITCRYQLKDIILVYCFKAACHAYPRADKKFAGSSSYTSRHIFLNFSNKSASNNISLWTNKLWYSPKSFISKSLQTLSILKRLYKSFFFSGNNASLNFS